ncbi:MAG: hypothetical protein M1379_15360 [Firmicutes bacterium]|nr:hypothetical protein [Bacillota bacterium]
MKKIALLLALVMILGIAAVASAAEVKTSGGVGYYLKYADGGLNFDGLDFNLQVAATISDQVSATIRLRPSEMSFVTVDTAKLVDPATTDPTTAFGSTTTHGLKYDKAYATIANFGLPLSVTLGLNSVYNDPFGGDGLGTVGGNLGMINVKTDDFSGFSAQVLSTLDKTLDATSGSYNLKAGYLNYNAEFGSFGLVAKPVRVAADDKFDFAVNAKVPVPSTPLTAQAEVISYGDSTKKLNYMAGASATVAGVDLYANYFAQTNAATSRITAGVSKEISGATYSLDLENVDNATTVSAGVGVSF